MAIAVKPPCDEGVILSGRVAPECEGFSTNVGRWVLLATILGSSMAFIDGTVVNVALPTLQRDFSATAAGAQWVVQAYSLLLAALILVGGSLGDRYGRRQIFAIGVVVFTIASVACGVAPNLAVLIVARALQGIGGALLVPGSLAIITAAFPEEERGRAIGTWSGFTAITSAIGPVLGGWMVEHLSWRSVFLMNVPLAVVVLLVTLRYVPESRDADAAPRLDWFGAGLVTVLLGTLIYGLTEAAVSGFANPLVLLLLAISAIAAVAFVIVERRVSNPMVPLSLFSSRTFSGTNLLTLFLYAALSGALYFFPFNLIQVQGYSSTAAGAAMLPMILLMFGLSRWAGGLVGQYGARLPLTIGPIIAGAGFLWFAVPGVGGSYWTTFFPAVLLLGFGMTVTVAPLTTAVMGAVDERHSGLASGINNAVSRAGGVIAIAAFGILMTATFARSLDADLAELDLPAAAEAEINDNQDQLAALAVPATLNVDQREAVARAVDESFVAGFRMVMIVSAVMALASGAAAAFTVSGKRARSPAQRVDPPGSSATTTMDRIDSAR
jgi:EmrB/QacA subfamily drug resistance transporter